MSDLMSERECVTVNILNRDYKVTCEPHQAEALHEAARQLNRNLGLLRVQGAEDRAYLSMALSMTYAYQGSQRAWVARLDRLRELSRQIDAHLDA